MTFTTEFEHISYDEDGDFLEYFYVKKVPPFYGEMVDEFITLLRSQETEEIIGIQIMRFADLISMKELEIKND